MANQSGGLATLCKTWQINQVGWLPCAKHGKSINQTENAVSRLSKINFVGCSVADPKH
jgi:hypothetical protein